MLITHGGKGAWLKSHPAQSPLLSSQGVSSHSLTARSVGQEAGNGSIHNIFHSPSSGGWFGFSFLRFVWSWSQTSRRPKPVPCFPSLLLTLAVKSSSCIWNDFSHAAKRNYSQCSAVTESPADPSEMRWILIRFYQERWRDEISILFSIYSSFSQAFPEWLQTFSHSLVTWQSPTSKDILVFSISSASSRPRWLHQHEKYSNKSSRNMQHLLSQRKISLRWRISSRQLSSSQTWAEKTRAAANSPPPELPQIEGPLGIFLHGWATVGGRWQCESKRVLKRRPGTALSTICSDAAAPQFCFDPPETAFELCLSFTV